VKEYLSQRGIPFQERDVSRNPAYARELMQKTGQMGVPVTVIKRQVVIGFDRGRLDQLLAQTRAEQRPSFGASIADASKIMAKQGSGIASGAYIRRVRAGSVAERISLAPGDIVIELNVKNIGDADDMERVLSTPNRGNNILVVFLRDHKRMIAQGTY